MPKTSRIICQTRRPVGLQRIHQPQAKAVIYRRKPSQKLIDFMNWLDRNMTPRMSFSELTFGQETETFIEIVRSVLAPYMPEPQLWMAFTNEIRRLDQHYRTASGASKVEISLRKDSSQYHFHADGPSLRLLINYFGGTTRYLSPGPTELREPLERFRTNLLEAGEYDPAQIRHMQHYDYLLLKGVTYPQDPPDVLWHASPDKELNKYGKTPNRLLLIVSGATAEEVTAHQRKQRSPQPR